MFCERNPFGFSAEKTLFTAHNAMWGKLPDFRVGTEVVGNQESETVTSQALRGNGAPGVQSFVEEADIYCGG
ncbi:hypothetical protein DV096_19985 [Bradymonadaceae bacterium TMQ3]|nr:hypothetical protein DV096_19985 [Bradymonadaceae bacterium TMQ3]